MLLDIYIRYEYHQHLIQKIQPSHPIARRSILH